MKDCRFLLNIFSIAYKPYITNGEKGLYNQLSTGGPLSACVDAESWQNYDGGVLTSCGNSVDHCVELVGYGNYGSAGGYWMYVHLCTPTYLSKRPQ